VAIALIVAHVRGQGFRLSDFHNTHTTTMSMIATMPVILNVAINCFAGYTVIQAPMTGIELRNRPGKKMASTNASPSPTSLPFE
jgi:hypothetical protein